MTLPSLILGLLIALLMGTLFHLWADGGLGHLLLYIALSVTGFGAGQWIGSSQGLQVLPVGPLDLGVAMVGSLLFMGAGHWLSLVRVQGRQPRNKV